MARNLFSRGTLLTPRSDYKDDGTNILLDANENAYGPGLALDGNERLDTNIIGTSDSSLALDVDFHGLNRYPDPYVSLQYITELDSSPC